MRRVASTTSGFPRSACPPASTAKACRWAFSSSGGRSPKLHCCARRTPTSASPTGTRGNLSRGFARRFGRRLARSGLARVPAFLRHAALEELDAQGLALLLVVDAARALERSAVAFGHVSPQHDLLLAGLDAALRKPRVVPQFVALSVRGSRRVEQTHEGEKARHEARLAYTQAMAVLRIAKMGNPVLLRKAQPVADATSPQIKQLAADMQETLEDIGASGLAAPQVFVSKRVVVYRIIASRIPEGSGLQPRPWTVMVNPVITPKREAKTPVWERCLSIPGLHGKVPRYLDINIRYQTLE